MKLETRLKIPLTAPAPAEVYPVMAELLDGGADDIGKVVLFSSQNVGTVVHVPNQCNNRLPVGYTNCNWISPYCAATWRILPSGTEVIIKQS